MFVYVMKHLNCWHIKIFLLEIIMPVYNITIDTKTAVCSIRCLDIYNIRDLSLFVTVVTNSGYQLIFIAIRICFVDSSRMLDIENKVLCFYIPLPFLNK